MRVVIAGGNGFIGRELTAQLLGAGHEVTWLSHRPGHKSPPEGVREVAFAPDDSAAEWTAEVAAADGVVNLSGYPISSYWNARRKALLCTSRIDTTNALVREIEKARATGSGPSVLVNASAVGIYGDSCERVLDEGSPLGDDFLACLSLDWEDAALAARESGCRVVTIRTGIVLGAEGVLPRMVLPAKLFLGGPIGSGRQWVSWVHHRDLAALYRFALENDQLSGAVNGGAPNPVRMSALAADIAHHIHRPSWFPVPVEVLRIVMGEVADYVVMSQRMTAEKALDAGFTYDFPTLEQALEDLLPEQRDGASEPAAEQSA